MLPYVHLSGQRILKRGTCLSCYIPLSLGGMTEEHQTTGRKRKRVGTNDKMPSTPHGLSFLRRFHRRELLHLSGRTPLVHANEQLPNEGYHINSCHSLTTTALLVRWDES